MILIYSKQKDEFVNDVIDYLSNSSFVRISNGNNFEYLESFFDFREEVNVSRIKNRFIGDINLQEVESIWFNGGTISLSDKNKINSPELNQLLFQNLNIVIDGLLESKDVNKIGNINNNRKSNKIQNLLIAQQLGLQVPTTFLTSNKTKLLEFLKGLEGEEVICKRINDSDSFTEENYLYDNSKTFLLTEDVLKKIPEDFGLSCFQQRVIKRYEIRSIYFNDKFYSSAIFDNRNDIDYRVNLHIHNRKPRIIPYNLPESLETKLRNLLKLLNYTFCSIDLMRNTNGEYIFLEINPSGQISYINNACNYYLEEKFADLLTI